MRVEMIRYSKGILLALQRPTTCDTLLVSLGSHMSKGTHDCYIQLYLNKLFHAIIFKVNPEKVAAITVPQDTSF